MEGLDVSKTNTPTPEKSITGSATGVVSGAAKQAKSGAVATYIVGACPILHDQDTYQPGDELELTEAQAKRLGSKVTIKA